MSEKSEIRDIPKFKKMREEMQGFKQLRNLLPVAAPILKVFGIDVETMSSSLDELPELEKEFLEISELPDRFNNAFASRGFIMFEALNIDVAKEALKIGENDLDAAEYHLVEHFTPEVVRTYLYMLHGIAAFRPRMPLAEKALVDYKEERYHASIPVILALMDGLVNELNPQQVGISADKSDLTAWDSITAHEKGLNALKAVLFKTRKTTRTEIISVPYRHGILHGMDLGYDNKIVAAKTWAALFAVRDWAAKVQKNEVTQPPDALKTSWKDVLEQLNRNRDTKERLEQWTSRSLKVDLDFPRTGYAEHYAEDTPERKVVEFLNLWRKNNYGHMAKCVWSFLQRTDMAKRLREAYQGFTLNAFELVEIIDKAPAISEVVVRLIYQHNGESVVNEVTFRLVINESPDGQAMMRGMPSASWGITNWESGTFLASNL